MGLEFTLDLTGDDPDSIDRGTKIEDGWYHVKLEDVFEDEKTQGCVVFKYIVQGAGRFAGKQIFDRLFDPANSKDDEGEEKTIRRHKLYASRLGLIGQGDYGQQLSGSWVDATGKEFLVRMVTKKGRTQNKVTGKWEDDPSKPEYTNPDYNGIFPLDYPKDKLKKVDKAFPWAELQHLLTGPETSGTAAAGSTAATGTAPAPTTNGGGCAGQRRFSDADL